ncbi:hypothetical protein AKJ16_DCAP01734 [Drosera capensis]
MDSIIIIVIAVWFCPLKLREQKPPKQSLHQSLYPQPNFPQIPSFSIIITQNPNPLSSRPLSFFSSITHLFVDFFSPFGGRRLKKGVSSLLPEPDNR